MTLQVNVHSWSPIISPCEFSHPASRLGLTGTQRTFLPPFHLTPLSPKSPHGYHSQQSHYVSSNDNAAKTLATSVATVEQVTIPTPPTLDTNVVVSSAPERVVSPLSLGTGRESLSIAEHGTSNTSKNKDRRDAAKISTANAYTPESANAVVPDKPISDLPLTVDSAGKLPEPLPKPHRTDDESDGALTIHFPPGEQQEQRLGDVEANQPIRVLGPADDQISVKTSGRHHDRRLSPSESDRPDDSRMSTATFSPQDKQPDDGVLGPQVTMARPDTTMNYTPFPPVNRYGLKRPGLFEKRSPTHNQYLLQLKLLCQTPSQTRQSTVSVS